ncbi:aminoglycoside phosphotransferase family protein [Saccharothrix deserti]|uniref:aminoglycoside phosphotransferase family protein n=1 Tax=Saccharothrix deserti TaxID=2593674 RepID=UPI00131D123C|nr:aminoglycoside phosphotransferase family protein [Saccharothrix deserti]
MFVVPPGFVEATIAREGEAGRRWVEALPALAAEFLHRWSCTTSGPVMHGFVGVVIPAVRADGSQVVLKLGFPLSYDTAEAVALAAWNGDGAVRLLERDDSRSAMLLERLRHLEKPDPAPFTAIGRLTRRLAIAAPPGVPSLADKALGWAEKMPAHAARLGSPLPAPVLDAAVANARDLATDQPAVLVHGDLHFGNVMRDDTGLRAIDPTGLVGDPAYELLPVLRGDWPAVTAEPNTRRAVDRRIAEFAEAAEVDRERVRRWAQARAAESALWSRQLHEPAQVTAVVDTLAALLM